MIFYIIIFLCTYKPYCALNINHSLASNRGLVIRRNEILRQVARWQVHFLERGECTNSNHISGSKVYDTS